MAFSLNTDGISEIYTSYNPSYLNLYEVTISNETLDNISLENYIKFHATNISFEDESLNLERNIITKNFQVGKGNDSFKRGNILTIQWREADDWKVKRYHEEWLKKFYDKENDYYISYSTSSNDKEKSETSSILYRIISITFPTFSKKLQFNNVLPGKAPGLNLSWSTSGNIVTHQLTYYVKDWEWVNIED